MERLTIDEIIAHCGRNVERNEKTMSREQFETGDMSSWFMKEYWEHRQVIEYLNELKAYKSALEQGLLLRLPCGHNETVYVIPTKENGLKKIAEMVCLGYSIGQPTNTANLFSKNRFNKDVPKMYQPNIDDFGKTWFLTEEEAELELANKQQSHAEAIMDERNGRVSK